MACKVTGSPDLVHPTVHASEGERVRFRVEVKGAKGAVAIATADETILATPADPSKVKASYTRVWSPPIPSDPPRRKTVSAIFSFPGTATGYQYEVEVFGAGETRTVKDVTVKSTVIGDCIVRIIAKLV